MLHKNYDRWDKQQVIDCVKHIVSELEIDYFPSCYEMRDFEFGNGLIDYIKRNIGYKNLAEEMGLPLKSSESAMGEEYEDKAFEYIEQHLQLPVAKTPIQYPYDLLVDGCVKVEVKSSRYQKMGVKKKSKSRSFSLRKRQPTCDLVVGYVLDEQENTEKVLVIPSSVLTNKTKIGIGKTSKWDRYKDKWELINDYRNFYKSKGEIDNGD